MAKCPECGKNLRWEAFWQGREVTCRACAARLQSNLLSRVLPPIAGLLSGSLVIWVFEYLEFHFALEILVTVIAFTGVWIGSNFLTARLSPREDEGIKLR